MKKSLFGVIALLTIVLSLGGCVWYGPGGGWDDHDGWYGHSGWHGGGDDWHGGDGDHDRGGGGWH